MAKVEELNDVYKKLPYCVEKDEATQEIKAHEIYPPFPWKFDEDIDRSKDNPKLFSFAGVLNLAE